MKIKVLKYILILIKYYLHSRRRKCFSHSQLQYSIFTQSLNTRWYTDQPSLEQFDKLLNEMFPKELFKIEVFPHLTSKWNFFKPKLIETVFSCNIDAPLSFDILLRNENLETVDLDSCSLECLVVRYRSWENLRMWSWQSKLLQMNFAPTRRWSFELDLLRLRTLKASVFEGLSCKAIPCLFHAREAKNKRSTNIWKSRWH